jgi:hypothetical protein
VEVRDDHAIDRRGVDGGQLRGVYAAEVVAVVA